MITTEEVRVKLTAALAALPDSPDAIARFLYDRGIRSEPRSQYFGRWCNHCPIAHYLEQEIGHQVLVTACLVTIWGFEYHLPTAVSAFIGKMDRGHYSALIQS